MTEQVEQLTSWQGKPRQRPLGTAFRFKTPSIVEDAHTSFVASGAEEDPQARELILENLVSIAIQGSPIHTTTTYSILNSRLDGAIQSGLKTSVQTFAEAHSQKLLPDITPYTLERALGVMIEFGTLHSIIYSANLLATADKSVKEFTDVLIGNNIYHHEFPGLQSANTNIADGAGEILTNLPLTSGDYPLTIIRDYAKVIARTMDEEGRYESLQEAMLSIGNLPQIVEFLSDKDWVETVLNSVDGIPTPQSGAVYAAPCSNVAVNADVQDGAIKAYGFFEREKALIAKSMNNVVQTISQRTESREVTLTDLGVGPEKFVHVVQEFQEQDYKIQNINLIDLRSQRLQEAKMELEEQLEDTTITTTNARFQDLELEPSEGASLVGYFGTTFCNHHPTKNFEFLRSTGSSHALVGIYHLPEGREAQEEMRQAYSTKQMKEHTKPIGKLMGLTDEDLEERCQFKTEITTQSKRLEFGERFEEVRTVVPYFEATEVIKTPLRTYNQGDRIGGLRSIKYTQDQFRGLAKQNGFNVLKEYQDGDITLYLMEDTSK